MVRLREFRRGRRRGRRRGESNDIENKGLLLKGSDKLPDRWTPL
jgi:hypothetical protein